MTQVMTLEEAVAAGLFKKGRTGRGRIPKDDAGMNKLEAKYARHLEMLKRAGEIVGYWFELVKFKLADKTSYSPDFLIMRPDGTLLVHEVKGFWEEDARVKIKVAAATVPLVFVAVTYEKGAWQYEYFAGATP